LVFILISIALFILFLFLCFIILDKNDTIRIIRNSYDIKINNLRENIKRAKNDHLKEIDDAVKALKADIKVLDEENEKFRKLYEKTITERDKLAKELNDLKTKEARKNYAVIYNLLNVVREIDNKIYDEIVV
jgi:septal ring factor EnvC (AmiA/AmiB activator)